MFSKVIVQKAIALPARKIVLMPEKPQLIKEERKAILKERLQEMVVLAGNRIPFSLGGDKKSIFWVQATQPEGPVQVESQTTLVFQDETGEGRRDNAISYQHIGGLEKEIERIRRETPVPGSDDGLAAGANRGVDRRSGGIPLPPGSSGLVSGRGGTGLAGGSGIFVEAKTL
jgi:hypothetical protein